MMSDDAAVPARSPDGETPTHDGRWLEHNAEGLSLARRGHWSAAINAFTTALTLLNEVAAGDGATPAAPDVVRAGLLLNAAQCCFHASRLVEARSLAEESCDLRVARYGETSLMVARTRSDLAVIVGAMGNYDEAMQFMEQAVSAVEQRADGDGDAAKLVPLLTNGVRLLAIGAPERAAPYAARLKALQPTPALPEPPSFPPTAVPVHSFGGSALTSAADDQLLRVAIARTADLLRAPARAVPAAAHDPRDGQAAQRSESSASQRSGARSIVGVRRGRTQFPAPRHLVYIATALVAFAAGIGARYMLLVLTR